jgi:hypothetical protein
MTLQLLRSEFPNIYEENFILFFISVLYIMGSKPSEKFAKQFRKQAGKALASFLAMQVIAE